MKLVDQKVLYERNTPLNCNFKTSFFANLYRSVQILADIPEHVEN